MNEWQKRLSDVLVELSIISSNCGHGWIQQSATLGYNAIVESIPKEDIQMMLQFDSGEET